MRTSLAAAVVLAAVAAPIQARDLPALSAQAEGRRLTVGWTSAPEKATEWEAFLSFDGGKSVSLRVTPHLPISTREFVFELPHLAAAQASVVFRFGDGDEERQFLLPATLEIDIDPLARLLTARAADAGARPDRGEESSIGWVESIEVTVVPPLASGIAPVSRLVLPCPRLAFTRNSRVSMPGDRTGRAISFDRTEQPRQRPPASAPDVLLLSSRLNV